MFKGSSGIKDIRLIQVAYSDPILAIITEDNMLKGLLGMVYRCNSYECIVCNSYNRSGSFAYYYDAYYNIQYICESCYNKMYLLAELKEV